MTINWLEWTPKASSVGFVGSSGGEIPIISGQKVTETPQIIRKGPEVEPTKPTELKDRVAGQTEIIGKSPHTEPTKPTEPKDGVSLGPKRPAYFYGPYADYYGWRLSVLQEFVSQLPAADGFIEWLEISHRYYCERLFRDLADRIDRGASAKISFDQFDDLCREWTDTYQAALDLYMKSQGPRAAIHCAECGQTLENAVALSKHWDNEHSRTDGVAQ